MRAGEPLTAVPAEASGHACRTATFALLEAIGGGGQGAQMVVALLEPVWAVPPARAQGRMQTVVWAPELTGGQTGHAIVAFAELAAAAASGQGAGMQAGTAALVAEPSL